MAWHKVTRSCGHEETIQITGNSSYRTWMASRLEGEPCSDCVAAKRAEENAAAAKENAESGLPALTGSDRQIGWAETIRKRLLDEVGEVLPELGGKEWFPAAMQTIQSQRSASWWIDRRDMAFLYVAEEVGRQISKGEVLPPPAELPAEILAEATMRPENPRTETVAEIAIREKTIHVTFPEKRESFRELMHGHGFRWSETHWARTVGPLAGGVLDRAAEVAAELLRARYIVRAFDATVREKAVSGSYEPEQKKWISESNGRFGISWPKDADYYVAARRLRGSMWDGKKYQVVVPAEQYAEVLGFAETHGFALHKKAQALADKARAVAEASLLCDPAPVPAPSEQPSLSVPVEVGIDASLRDDN